jgi:hypothetical protein
MPIVALDPSMQAGSTVGQADNVTSSCQLGGAPEVVFEVTAAHTGNLDLLLDSAADLGLYVQTSCGDVFSEIGCVDDNLGFDTEFLSVPVTQGDVVYVFVDGYDVGEASSFTLSIATSDTAGACSAALAIQASQSGDTTAGSNVFTGSCTGGGAFESLFTFTPPSDGLLSLTLDSVDDLGLYVRETCGDASTEIACVDDNFGGSPEILTVSVLAGVPVTVFVDGYTPADFGPFILDQAFTPTAESEPNDDHLLANAYVNPFDGAISVSGDQDYISIVVPGPSSTLTAQVTDIGNLDCANFVIDPEVEIFGTDGVSSLAYNDDFGADYCSEATASGRAAGTYFVRVSASSFSPSSTFLYRLNLTVQ